MYSNRGNAVKSIWARSGPALGVIGFHALVIYGVMVSTGVVELPRIAEPAQVVFIPEQTEIQPEPEVPEVKPEIENVMPLEEPLPQVQFDVPVVPPSETPVPASANAISATEASGAVAQELKTSHRVEPTYPAISRRMSEEGTVRLKVLVDERGRAQDVAVAKSSGFARLDNAAMEAVRRWRFVAATDGQNAITAWTQVAITFRLTSSG